MASRTAAVLDAGNAALHRGDWATARSAFEAALDQQESPEILYGLAQALWWHCEYARVIELMERAYAGFRARGETRTPAVIACLLAFDYAAVFGNDAASSGWIERAKRLIADEGDCFERGRVELECTFATDDVAKKEEHLRRARDIARRIGSADLEFTALSLEGTCLVRRGRIREGMRRLDEAVAAASSGEVRDFLAVGEIYCEMLQSCELVVDVRRAEQWMEVAEAFVRRTNFLPISAICRTHYGGFDSYAVAPLARLHLASRRRPRGGEAA